MKLQLQNILAALAVINVNSCGCKFTLKKDGYKTLNLLYKVTQSESIAAYLQRTISEYWPNGPHPGIPDGSLEGFALPGVLINGRDCAGGKFNKAMDENGIVLIWGTPES